MLGFFPPPFFIRLARRKNFVRRRISFEGRSGSPGLIRRMKKSDVAHVMSYADIGIALSLKPTSCHCSGACTAGGSDLLFARMDF